jgi:hypothetical protein
VLTRTQPRAPGAKVRGSQEGFQRVVLVTPCNHHTTIIQPPYSLLKTGRSLQPEHVLRPARRAQRRGRAPAAHGRAAEVRTYTYFGVGHSRAHYYNRRHYIMDMSHRASVLFLPRPTQPADHWRGCCVSNLLAARRGRAWRSVPLATERAQRYARSWLLLSTKDNLTPFLLTQLPRARRVRVE